MSFKTLWLDILTREVFSLTISNKVIYRATSENINLERNPKDLLGSIICPLSSDIIRKTFVVYMNSAGNVSLAPVKDYHIEAVKENQSIFQKPLNIRVLYDIISL